VSARRSQIGPRPARGYRAFGPTDGCWSGKRNITVNADTLRLWESQGVAGGLSGMMQQNEYSDAFSGRLTIEGLGRNETGPGIRFGSPAQVEAGGFRRWLRARR
jgi:hypothetical protein